MHKALCAAFAALLFLPAATATPDLLPPTALHATSGHNGTAELAWAPPLGAAAGLAYAVYADGLLAAVVEEPRLTVTVGAPVLYAVTALHEEGESLPAFTIVGRLRVAPGMPIDTGGPNCAPLATNLYTHYPFVAVAVYTECLPVQV